MAYMSMYIYHLHYLMLIRNSFQTDYLVQYALKSKGIEIDFSANRLTFWYQAQQHLFIRAPKMCE